VLDATPYPEFDAAARATLDHLRERMGLAMWTVARRQADGWRVLYQAGQLGGSRPGSRLAWSELCSAAIDGAGPPVAPVVAEVPSYAEALARRGHATVATAARVAVAAHHAAHPHASHPHDLTHAGGLHRPQEIVPEVVGPELGHDFGGSGTNRIGAFIGVPVQVDDGVVFGLLAGVDPDPQPPELAAELPALRLIAKLLGTVLSAELRAEEAARDAERAEAAGGRDALTGLANRQGWNLLLRSEEDRARRYGSPAAVISIDLEGNDRAVDDDVVQQAAKTVVAVTRAHDVVARLGGAELAVLAVECDTAALDSLVRRLEDELAAMNIPAVVGAASRTPDRGLDQAWIQADAAVAQRMRRPTPA
jgi:diguanylate cyclase (GGDEF)-like protein